ncbi:MAG: cyclodeaminase/cyclohydrolase family protein [Burkholderiales bacterium]|nr:cyclodeaminase/cyclohydrolase family protein [Burkholderiales bacterium]
MSQTLQSFLDALASNAPAPGGGAAAALMGATGAALVSMVCNLTLGKPKYAEVEGDMSALREQSEALRARLTAMMEDDQAVFRTLMSAYGLPKQTDDEKAARKQAIQEALKRATEVPLACARACVEAIALSREAAEKGSLQVVSDAGVAVAAAEAGLKSAALNVWINVPSIEDQAFAKGASKAIAALIDAGGEDGAAVYALVKSKP